MSRRLCMLWVLGAVWGVSLVHVGCGTIASYTLAGTGHAGGNPFVPPKGVPMVSGVRFDALLIGTNFDPEPFLPWSVLAIFDLPLSLAFDLAILPWTFLWWLLTEEPSKDKKLDPKSTVGTIGLRFPCTTHESEGR